MSFGRRLATSISSSLFLLSLPVMAYAAINVNSVTVGPQVGTLTSGTAGSVTFAVSISATGNNSTFTPSVTGLPSGVTASFSPATVTTSSYSGTMTLTSTAAAPAGTSPLTVTISNKSNNTRSLVIGAPLISTTTTVISSDNPSNEGQSVTFTASVSGAPAGNVEFFVDSVSVGTVALSAGSAAYTTSSLTPGTHSVTANYLGNSTYAASSGNTVNQTVIAESTVTIVKNTVDGSGSFDFSGSFGEFSLDTTGDNTESAVFNVYPAVQTSYDVTEDVVLGWDLTSYSCVSAYQSLNVVSLDGTLTFNLEQGEDVTCTFTNTKAICGNGVIQSGEVCDDGDTDGGDGCNATCDAVEAGFSCLGEPSVCATTCGDGIAAGAEQCDEGESNSDTDPDACRTSCVAAYCGDTVVDSSEQCDDGNGTSNDGCSATCVAEVLICHIAGNGNEIPQYVLPSEVDGHLNNHGDYLGQCTGASSSVGNTVEICHNPNGNNPQTQSFPAGSNALASHLAHGDTLGACGASSSSASSESSSSSDDSSASSESSSSEDSSASSESSVSSESSSEISSISSEASSSSANTNPAGISLPEVANTNASHRGSRTNILRATVSFLSRMIFGEGDTAPGGFGGVAPGGFGGSENAGAYSESELRMICSMQKALPRNTTRGVLTAVAIQIAKTMNRDVDSIVEALIDISLCSSDQQAAAGTTLIAFPVSVDGYPLSDNPTWNKCVTGKFTYEDIQANPDRDGKGTPKSCADYHTGASWYHPGLSVFFTWDASKKQLTLPEGYVIQKMDTVTLR